MSANGERLLTDSPGTVLHWYDFTCPFCYVAQHRNAILMRHGLHVDELAFQAHPEIAPGGILIGPRKGPMYSYLEEQAARAGLPLNWPPRLPDSREALAVAEWVRRFQPASFAQLSRELFAAHFALGEDIADRAVIDRHATNSGVDLPGLHAALADGSAARLVAETQRTGREHGVEGTPSWFLYGRLITGLRPAADFEQLGEYARSR